MGKRPAESLHPVRAWRRENDVTLAQLAETVEVTPSHLSEIERGENAPSLGLAGKLSRATGVPLTKIEAYHAAVA